MVHGPEQRCHSIVISLQVSAVMLKGKNSTVHVRGRVADPLRRDVDQRRLTIALVLATATVVLASIEMWFFHQRLLGRLVREDGPLENAEAVSYFASSFLLFYLVIAKRVRNIWVAGVALLFFLVGGEEISWGQRIFSVATPEALRAVNVQGETNIHNVEGINGSVRALSLLVLWGIFVAIPVGTLLRPTDRIIRWLALPVANWGSSVAIVVGTVYMILARAFGENVFQLDEIGELLVSMAALGLAVGLWSARQEQQSSSSEWQAPSFRNLEDETASRAWKSVPH
jgi:glucan phosphoethanolaminetransferase (alkaline phosphatase superfamily)